MKNMKKSFIFILLVMMIISISAVCATEDADNLQSTNDEMNDVKTLNINDIDETSLEEASSNASEVLSTDSHKSGEGYIEFENDEYEIDEGQQNINIKGTVYCYDYGYYEYDWEDVNLYCNYTDGNNVARSYTLTAKSSEFNFDLSQCEGLIASQSPYTLMFSPVEDNYYDVFLDYNDYNPLANSWVTLTVKESQITPVVEPKTIYVGPNGVDSEGYGIEGNPYKTIAYAVSQALDNDIIYVYEGTYDENSINLNKTLTVIGQNRNVIIGSTKTAQGQKIFDDSNRGASSYRFVNLTFKDVSFGSNSLIFNLQNTGSNEITNCTFEGLTLRIVINSLSNETSISNCEFKDVGINQVMTGAMAYLGGKSSIKDTKFTGSLNKAAMSYVNLIQTTQGTQLIMDNVTISGTTGKYNLVNVNKDTTTTIKNSKIINNDIKSQSASMGGMLFSATGSNLFFNVTQSVIANNTPQNGFFYGLSDTMNFIANYNIIYNNSGKIMINANPKYNLDYNYWGLNKAIDITLNNWIVVEPTVNPSEVMDGEDFKVTATLKVTDSEGNVNDLEKSIPQLTATFEYNNNEITKDIAQNTAETTFTFDKTAKEIKIKVLDETLTANIAEKEFKVYVGPEGVDAEGYGTKDKPYKTIKYAVSKADPNYTVYIYEGRYDENSITLNKNLTILGENKNVIITSSRDNVKIFEAAYNSNGNHISLRFENLTFDTIKPGMFNAILNLRNDDRNEIVNCVFTNTDNQYNIWSASKETLIENCEFKDITFTSAGYIVYISGPGKHDLINNTFDKISSNAAGVVSLINIINRPHNISIENITITNVTGNIYGININNNGYGDVNNSVSIKNALIEDNELKKTTSNQGGAIFITAGSPTLTVTNSTIKNNYAARGIFAGTSSETKINANYNLIENNDGAIIFSVSEGSPVTDYNVDYNYWGSENPNLDDLKVNNYFANEDLTELITIKQPVEPNMEVKVDEEITEGKTLTIEVTLNEDATGTVTITGIEGVIPQTLENGKTTFEIQNLKANQYPITITYSGDESYTERDYETTITVKEPKADIPDDAKNVSMSIPEGTTSPNFTINLPENATGTFSIYVDGKEYLKELVNGSATITVEDLAVGDHNISIKYSGDEKFNGFETENKTVTIPKATIPGGENAINTTTPEGSDSPSYTISLPPDATGNLTVTVDGVNYSAPLINGSATVNIPKLAPGNHNITITYSGDDKYTGISKNTTLYVPAKTTPKTPTTKKVATKITAKKKTFKAKKKVKKYTITLKAGKKPVKKVWVTLKIKGKKLLKAKTNAKGKATFKIKKLTKKGKYKATIKFKGNKNYKTSSKKVKITIK
jgi:hypothetical protein